MLAVTVNAWWRNEQRESLEELEGRERESGAAARCGTGKTIDDGLASGRKLRFVLQPANRRAILPAFNSLRRCNGSLNLLCVRNPE